MLLKTELVIRATAKLLQGELEDLDVMCPDPIRFFPSPPLFLYLSNGINSILLIKDGMQLFRQCACRLGDLTAHVCWLYSLCFYLFLFLNISV